MKNPINHCKICFKNFENEDLYELINADSYICKECQNRLVPKFIKFSVDGVDALAIYEYDDTIKSLLYQLKGCYDIELAPIFLNRFKKELHLRYEKYVLLPAPSYYVDDEKREFKHVDEIFKVLNLPILSCFRKISPFKQAEHSKKEREEIIEHIRLIDGEKLANKKVLIVDDVTTTGSTLRALVQLAKTANPKAIKILVMSKRII